MQNGIPLTEEMQLQLAERYGGLEQWGAPIMDPHYSAAWAWAGATPFQWGKQVGSHLGGTRNPLVVHWPTRIKDAGGLRTPFTHVIDVAPTILDVAGLPEPATVDGIEQEPMHGSSFSASFTDGGAARTPHPAVFRDGGQPRHVQGRLVAGHEDRTDPVGRSRPTPSVRMRRASGTPTPVRPSSTTCLTTSPRRKTLRPTIPRRCRS